MEKLSNEDILNMEHSRYLAEIEGYEAAIRSSAGNLSYKRKPYTDRLDDLDFLQQINKLKMLIGRLEASYENAHSLKKVMQMIENEKAADSAQDPTQGTDND